MRRIRRPPGLIKHTFAVLVLLASAAQAADTPPANEPAQIKLTADRLTVSYDGATLFEGRIANPAGLHGSTLNTFREGGAVTQVLTLLGKQGTVEISGTLTAGAQAFPAESDPPSVKGPRIVRHTSGLSHSLRNHAIYDRQRDWLLSVDDQLKTLTRIVPLSDHDGRRTFSLDARGTEIVLRFRPRFYQQHRGVRFYQPWTYEVWQKPIVGWVSWFAFFEKVTEADIKRTADVMADVLKPYGYEYLQVDDGYQREKGAPDSWLRPNAKFPSGMPALAEYIHTKGFKPGLWTYATLAEIEETRTHKDWFVRDASGNAVVGQWSHTYPDASNPAALNGLIRPLYSELRRTGWDYFKVDGLRHLRYEGYNSHPDHFRRKRADAVEAFRRYARAIREEIGGDRFMLACWGVRPELVGIADGVRIGGDGFSFAGLAQYNSFNNVVWRNDPDHIELSDREAWRSSMVTSLTGSLFMLTDKPERYQTPYVEPAKRAAPVLFTLPGQLYDVDPSRSENLWRVDSEVSGRDPKPFDAGVAPAADLYQLDIVRPFEAWTVLGRTGGVDEDIAFEALGLDPMKEYFVYEFWTRRLRGSSARAFTPGPIDPTYNSQIFIIRERLARPQIISTSRHITGGGVDLKEVTWKDYTLRGESAVVAGDSYEISLTEPQGYKFQRASCGEADLVSSGREGATVKIVCRSAASRTIAWTANYE